MKQHDLHELFIDELKDMYDAEQQIIEGLTKFSKLASSADLKLALTDHLNETKNQVKRLEEVFSLLGLTASGIKCKGIEGILKEGDEMVKNKNKSATLDAAIISAVQKVEHYEIASYGTLRSFAKHLSLDSEVSDLLQENLDEEGAADKKLTKLADGSIFSGGLNQDAAEQQSSGKKEKSRI